MPITNDRMEIETIVTSDPAQAYSRLNAYLTSHTTLDDRLFAEKLFLNLAKPLHFKSLRIAVLRSITLESIVPYVRVGCFQNRINPEIYLAGYNLFEQEILNSGSDLYRFAPDVLIVFNRIEELAPRLHNDFLSLTRDQVAAEIDGVVRQFSNLLSQFRSRCAATIIIHNFELPAYPALGLTDAQPEGGERRAIERCNSRLSEVCRDYADVFVLDYERLTSLHGKIHWFDEKFWYAAHAPLSRIAFEALAAEYVRCFRVILGMTKKCLVLDLDNTLWGGIVGEDGIEGIKLGSTSPGNAYVDFQRELLQLHRKGFLLAVNSKNDEALAMETIEKHPSMVLRKEHFAAVRINWHDKAQNIREIAAGLNIGIDSIVFFDDNPAERELIRQQLPEVEVVDLPSNPHRYPAILKVLPFFDLLRYNEEDRGRGAMYAQQSQREALRASSSSMEEYYRSLQMQASISINDSFCVPRLAQMTQKTNQFNLTTIRYSEGEIAALIATGTARVYALGLTDRFGDNGIVGAIIVRESGEEASIDTFLLSCRVIQRTVEVALLAYVVADEAKRGCKLLRGVYLPTKKNGLVHDIYQQLGFEQTGEKDGTTFWEVDPSRSTLAIPEWIRIT